MKKVVCIICCFIALYAATNVLSAVTWLRPQKNIDLKAIVNNPSPKSPVICESVDVEQYATSIEIGFKANLGNLDIEVTDPSGLTVFEKKVNAATGSGLSIATQNWASGTYTIRILNTQGNGCEGKFDI